MEVNRNTAAVHRPLGKSPYEKRPKRGEVKEFSTRSEVRVRRLAADAVPALVSQLGLTYHGTEPDGPTSKEHLRAFLAWLRRRMPGVRYLWVMEWQKRGVVHYHVFLTAPVGDSELWAEMAEIWARITGEGQVHKWWHGPARGKNWIAWDMKDGSYVAKYLDKKEQKQVPEGWGWVGRFWGASRGLVPPPEVVRPAEMCAPFGTINPAGFLVRTLERYHHAKCRAIGRRSRLFKDRVGGRVFGGARIVEAAVRYLERWGEAQAMERRGPWGRLPG